MVLTIQGNVINAVRTLAIADGSAAAPAYSFAANLSSGMFRFANNALGLASNGQAIVVVTPSGLTVNGTISARNLTNYTYPTISNVSITDASFTVLDDTAVSNGGWLQIDGTNFAGGSVVYLGATPTTSTSVVSSSRLRAQIGNMTNGTYSVTVLQPSGVLATKPLGVTVSPFPAWGTSSNLATAYAYTPFTYVLSANSDSNITYANTTSLPPNTTLVSNGLLSGNVVVANSTTYTFDVNATDVELQNVMRTFSLFVQAV